MIDDQANSGLRPIRVRLKRYVRDIDATRLEGGGSQPKVFAAEDETLWLVKAMNNPQGIRTLANELVGTSLARRIGGTVPRPAVCDLPTELATDVRFSSGQAWQAGPSFGSELLDSSWQPTHEMLERVINPGALLAVVAADTWLGQFDQRQARAVADEHGGYTIWAVDFGYSIGNPGWSAAELAQRGEPTGIHDPQGWVRLAPSGAASALRATIEGVLDTSLRALVGVIPPEWRVLPDESEALVSYLTVRRRSVSSLVSNLGRLGSAP